MIGSIHADGYFTLHAFKTADDLKERWRSIFDLLATVFLIARPQIKCLQVMFGVKNDVFEEFIQEGIVRADVVLCICVVGTDKGITKPFAVFLEWCVVNLHAHCAKILDCEC